MPLALQKMVFSFVKLNTGTKRKKSTSMLSLSLFGTSSTTSSPTYSIPSPSPSPSRLRSSKHMKASSNSTPTRTQNSTSSSSSSSSTITNTSSSSSTSTPIPSTSFFLGSPTPPLPSGNRSAVRAEAVTFLGLLRHNEEQLEARLKPLLKQGDDKGEGRRFVRALFSQLIDGWTPLHACVLRGARSLVKLALKAGVPADLEMGWPLEEGLPARCSPLHLAAYRGDVSVLQVLVQVGGASLEKRDSTGRTPLHYAASRDNALAVRKLLKYGAEESELTPEQRDVYARDIERHRRRSHLRGGSGTKSGSGSLLCIPVSPFSSSSSSTTKNTGSSSR